MKLTEHFSLEDFTTNSNTIPSKSVINNLRSLCVNVLETAMKQFGRRMQISYGYLDEEFCNKIENRKYALHKYGLGCCIQTYSKDSLNTLYEILRRRKECDRLSFETINNELYIHVMYGCGRIEY